MIRSECLISSGDVGIQKSTNAFLTGYAPGSSTFQGTNDICEATAFERALVKKAKATIPRNRTEARINALGKRADYMTGHKSWTPAWSMEEAKPSPGLIAFGVLQILIGVVCAMLVLYIASGSDVMVRQGPGGGAALASGMIVYVVATVYFFAAGVGSIKRRRWAQALSVVVSAMSTARAQKNPARARRQNTSRPGFTSAQEQRTRSKINNHARHQPPGDADLGTAIGLFGIEPVAATALPAPRSCRGGSQENPIINTTAHNRSPSDRLGFLRATRGIVPL